MSTSAWQRPGAHQHRRLFPRSSCSAAMSAGCRTIHARYFAITSSRDTYHGKSEEANLGKPGEDAPMPIADSMPARDIGCFRWTPMPETAVRYGRLRARGSAVASGALSRPRPAQTRPGALSLSGRGRLAGIRENPWQLIGLIGITRCEVTEGRYHVIAPIPMDGADGVSRLTG